MAELREQSLDGINVTMPLKEEAARACDHLSPAARASMSVNMLRLRGGRIEGDSSDAAAMAALVASPRFDPEAPILVLGAGGAAAAALQSLAGRRVSLSARREGSAAEAAARAGYPVGIVAFATGVPGAVVVNATPLGMHGESLPMPVLEVASGLIDLAYGSEEPPATSWARRQGLPLVDGVEFLTEQAVLSFNWWTGLHAPREVMLAAARNG